jgi:hypothetical protein
MSGDKAHQTQSQNHKFQSRAPVRAAIGSPCGSKKSLRVQRRRSSFLSTEAALTLASKRRENLANCFSGAYRG